MASIAERVFSVLDNFETLKPLLFADGLATLAADRDAALARFKSVGLPTAKDEEFKYLPLEELGDTRFQPAYGANVFREDLAETPLAGWKAHTFAFVNGRRAPELDVEGALPQGVVVASLADCLDTKFGPLIRRHFGKIATQEGRLGRTNDDRLAWLNTSFFEDGAFVYVPKGVDLEHPLHLLFVAKADHGPLATHPRSLIVIEEGATARIVESYAGLGGTYLNNPVTEVWMGERSNLDHTRVQSESADAYHLAVSSAFQLGDSVLNSTTVAYGAKKHRLDLSIYVGGEHAETWMNGVYVGAGERVVDNHTRLDHAVPNCHSFETYKGVLMDKSTGVFNGKIFVYQDAQKTDAKQTNQALLLSPEAAINTKPQLEIFADDVKCTHGATVGRIREDALFYLRSRGIPEPEARALLVYAFAAEVLEKIGPKGVSEALEKTLFEALGVRKEV